MQSVKFTDRSNLNHHRELVGRDRTNKFTFFKCISYTIICDHRTVRGEFNDEVNRQ
ncbi:MAG: hypothetical protein LBR79_00930 [Oscillospiraceae bacterium]|nr:hypothetical protein [Oscillospiraceae bacterium]